MASKVNVVTLSEEDDAVDRAFGLGILSLDLAVPAFASLGLAPVSGELTEALRRGHDVALADAPTAASIVDATRRALSQRLGASGADFFERWFDAIWLGSARDAQANRWRSIVTFGKTDGARDMREVPDVVKRLREAIAGWPRPPTLERGASTPWDQALFEELGYEADPRFRAPEDASPATSILNRVEHAAFCAAWEEVVARGASPDADREALWRFRRHEAVILDISLELLSPPTDWQVPRLAFAVEA